MMHEIDSVARGWTTGMLEATRILRNALNLSPEQINALHAWHDDVAWPYCTGYSEGQSCCIDFLVYPIKERTDGGS